MKKLIIGIFMCFSIVLNGQNSSTIFFEVPLIGGFELNESMTYLDIFKANKKRYIITTSATFLAGAINGISEDLLFHYSQFKRTFPNATDAFWNPSESWKNKHEWSDGIIVGPKYPFSRTLLAWTTDGKHALDTGRRLLITTSIIFSFSKKKNWMHYIIDAIVLTAIRNLGFHLTYSLIIK